MNFTPNLKQPDDPLPRKCPDRITDGPKDGGVNR